MEHASESEPVFYLDAGRLCLDFINTLSWRPSGKPTERFHTYRNLVSWAQLAGVVDDARSRQLLLEAERRPAEAAAVLSEAIDLREAIYRIFAAISAGQSPSEADLAGLNASLSAAMSKSRIIRGESGFVWDWDYDGGLDYFLWPVVRSAADLLTSPDLQLLRACAAPDCGWLFLDTSRNRTRRWCYMNICGNRAKVRRHYTRMKEA